MLQQESRLTVADNTGAKTALVIRVLGGTKKRYASVGDKIVVAIKSGTPNGTAKNQGDSRNGDERNHRDERLFALGTKVAQADKEFVVHKSPSSA